MNELLGVAARTADAPAEADNGHAAKIETPREPNATRAGRPALYRATKARVFAEAAAVAEPNVARFLEGQVVKKVIVVPGKIVNIVAG